MWAKHRKDSLWACGTFPLFIFSPLFGSIWIHNKVLNGTWTAIISILISTFLPSFGFVELHGNPLSEQTRIKTGADYDITQRWPRPFLLEVWSPGPVTSSTGWYSDLNCLLPALLYRSYYCLACGTSAQEHWKVISRVGSFFLFLPPRFYRFFFIKHSWFLDF